MTLAIVLVLCAAVALAIILRISLRRALPVPVADLKEQIQLIDVEAFRNLIDTHEDEYLRERLPGREFRAVRRARLRATAAYIRSAGANAAVLAHLAQAALSAKDAATAEAARQLVDSALLLRRNAAFALVRIYVALAWPNVAPAATGILRGYEQLSGSAMLLGRLQNPAAVMRLSAP
jgi:hypothetical protein